MNTVTAGTGNREPARQDGRAGRGTGQKDFLPGVDLVVTKGEKLQAVVRLMREAWGCLRGAMELRPDAALQEHLSDLARASAKIERLAGQDLGLMPAADVPDYADSAKGSIEKRLLEQNAVAQAAGFESGVKAALNLLDDHIQDLAILLAYTIQDQEKFVVILTREVNGLRSLLSTPHSETAVSNDH